jgi:exportin-T
VNFNERYELCFFRQYKRARKSSSGPLEESRRSFLVSLMEVILTKLKWDESPELDDADEDDIAEFEKMRKVDLPFSYRLFYFIKSC